MYGIYDDIIDAAQKALDCFDETQEILEYPEVQADKAYYLSVLSKYNKLKYLKDRLFELTDALEEEKTVSALLSDASSEAERTAIYAEIYSLKSNAMKISASLADALGCRCANERVYCRFRFKEISSKLGMALFNLMKSDLISHGAKIEDVKTVYAKDGYVQEISFIADGAGTIMRLVPFAGTHKVYIAQARSEELCFAVTPSARVEKVSEKDLKIDVFHSGGAGGQNVNKVETAVRVMHLPTGLSVVCQDERSQLKNKRRALETIEKRLKERGEQSEKRRIEADISAQYAIKNTPISFDASSNTFSDTRLKAFSKIPFPLTDAQFATYVNGLIVL